MAVRGDINTPHLAAGVVVCRALGTGFCQPLPPSLLLVGANDHCTDLICKQFYPVKLDATYAGMVLDGLLFLLPCPYRLGTLHGMSLLTIGRCLAAVTLDCRILGVAFAVPATYFAARGYINRPLGKRLGVCFLMGGAQGLVGWWMVRSGLEVRVRSFASLPGFLVSCCMALSACVEFLLQSSMGLCTS